MINDLGILSYDVPSHRRQIYTKLRNRLKRTCMMLTWSVYLIPWARKDDAEKFMKEVNTEDGITVPIRDQVRFSLAKFDSSDPKRLEDLASTAMQNMLSQTKRYLIDTLAKREEEWDEDTAKKKYRKAVTRAKKNIKEMRRLTLIFSMTDVFEAAFLAYERYLDTKLLELETTEKPDESEENEGEEA